MPVSPLIRIVVGVGATVSINWKSARMRGLRPIIDAEAEALIELLTQVGVLVLQPPLLERRVQDVQQLLELERLGDEVGGAALDRLDRVLDRPVAGDDDGDDARIALEGGLDDLAAVDARAAGGRR